MRWLAGRGAVNSRPEPRGWFAFQLTPDKFSLCAAHPPKYTRLYASRIQKAAALHGRGTSSQTGGEKDPDRDEREAVGRLCPQSSEERQVATWTTREAERFVRTWKEQHPCSDCSDKAGQPVFYPSYQMEFDHVAGKRITLGYSRDLRKLNEEEIRIEISRCDLVCRNCHAEREHARRAARRMQLRMEEPSGIQR